MITIHKYELEILLEGIEDTLRVMSGVDYNVDKYDPRNVENTANIQSVIHNLVFDLFMTLSHE